MLKLWCSKPGRLGVVQSDNNNSYLIKSWFVMLHRRFDSVCYVGDSAAKFMFIFFEYLTMLLLLQEI